MAMAFLPMLEFKFQEDWDYQLLCLLLQPWNATPSSPCPADTTLCPLISAMLLLICFAGFLLNSWSLGGCWSQFPRLCSLPPALPPSFLSSSPWLHTQTLLARVQNLSSDCCSSDSCWASLHGCLIGLSHPKPWLLVSQQNHVPP